MNQTDLMRLALEEGQRGLGLVHPNPPVGCVIADPSGNIIGKGAHLKFGGPHAEITAIQSLKPGSSLEGAVFYVTLEPCAHEGKTPSCAKTLAALPISKVVYAVQDPNPLVAGKGAEILRAAGKEVELIEDSKLTQKCAALAEIFLYSMKHSAPFVGLKAGTSRNGSLVPEDGGKWITSKESRQHVHFLRSQYDAVLVGVDTFLQDDPSLNIRLNSEKENIAIVIDPNGRGLSKLKSSNLYKSRSADKIIWVVDSVLETDLGISLLNIESDDTQINIQQLLDELWKMDIKSIFIEGGAKTYGSFLNAGLVNRIYHYSSPAEVSEEKMLYWLGYFKGEIQAKGPLTKFKIGPDEYESFLL